MTTPREEEEVEVEVSTTEREKMNEVDRQYLLRLAFIISTDILAIVGPSCLNE